VLLSGGERKALVQRADGQGTLPLTEGATLLGGVLRVGRILEHAVPVTEPISRSNEWKNPAVVIETMHEGQPAEQLVVAAQPRGVFLPGGEGALLFEKREKEVKAYLSHVTARQDKKVERAVISVNDPFTFAGWTLYQVNYNPEDPTYSGLEAVRDPGIFWVFFGFVLICVGVFYMFYVEPKFRGGGIERPATPPAQA
jgi:hypothetical protein